MDIEAIRRKYAEDLRASAHIRLSALVEAFARVPRERFLDPGPWQIAQPLDPNEPYATTPDASLEHIYHDVVVAIDPARQINNGQPSAHARWIDAASPRPGESVLHIGCGTGYYSAILAELVGATGRVTAYEVEPELAARASACLSDWPQAHVVAGDAAEPEGSFNVIYVNAGATHARRSWIEALTPGGRMILPLTAQVQGFQHGVGFVVRIERSGERWPASVVSQVGIYNCAGARDEAAEAQIRRLFAPGAAAKIHAVSIEPHERGEACLVHVEGFCLQE